jgi:hypothetical protein
MNFHDGNDPDYSGDSVLISSTMLLDQPPVKPDDEQDLAVSHHDYRSGIVGDDDEDALSSLLMLAAQQPETPEHNSPVATRNGTSANQNIGENYQNEVANGARKDNITEEDQQTAQILSSFKNNNNDNSLLETGKSFSNESAPIQVCVRFSPLSFSYVRLCSLFLSFVFVVF